MAWEEVSWEWVEIVACGGRRNCVVVHQSELALAVATEIQGQWLIQIVVFFLCSRRSGLYSFSWEIKDPSSQLPPLPSLVRSFLFQIPACETSSLPLGVCPYSRCVGSRRGEELVCVSQVSLFFSPLLFFTFLLWYVSHIKYIISF